MRRILFLFLMLSSVGAWAEDYYWTHPYASTQYPSAVDACIAGYPVSPFAVHGLTYFAARSSDDPGRIHCDGKRLDGSIATGLFAVIRRGDSCPEGTEYNPETGACDEPEPDECEELEGVTRNFRRSGTAPDAFMFIGGGAYAYDQNICVAGCSASVADAKCTVKLDGPYTCVGSSTFTGTQCTGGPGGADPDTSSDETDETAPPEPERTEENKPCIYTTGPGGVQTCISEQNQQNDGSCGTFNGAVVCNPAPSKTDKTIETTVQTTTNPDGSTTTTKTDTLTNNNCVGANACTTTTTTTTTTTKRNGNGDVESVSGSCTGPQCPDKDGNPDGDGDGFGDCIGPNCGQEDGGEFEGAELGEVKDFGESVDDFMERAGNAPIMQAVSGIAFPSGGSCSFGAASTPIGTISLDGICNNAHWLDPLYPIFLAVWCFAAIRVFMEA